MLKSASGIIYKKNVTRCYERVHNKAQDHKIILLHLKKALAIWLHIIKDSF